MTFESELLSLRPTLERFAGSLLKARNCDVDDLVQETLFRALANRHQFKLGTNLRAWCFTIMKSQFLQKFVPSRKSRRHLPILVDDFPVGTFQEPSTTAPQPYQAELNEVAAKLPQLSPLHQHLLLDTADGLSCEELAAKHGCPVGTVKSRLTRARAALRTLTQ